MFKWLLRLIVLVVLYQTVFYLYWLDEVRPIPSGLGAYVMPNYVGKPSLPKPLGTLKVPQHPFMAPNGASNMHCDAYSSDVSPFKGPLGIKPQIASVALGQFIGGQCPFVAFDRYSRLVVLSSSFDKQRLLLMHPYSLKVLAQLDLPGRPSNKSFNVDKIVTDTSGAYFYLDQEGNVVLASADNKLHVIEIKNEVDSTFFSFKETYDLSPALIRNDGVVDKITTVQPDWNGWYWLVTRYGTIGIVNPHDGNIKTLNLGGEEIQNSFTIAEDGVFVVSDEALYCFEMDSVKAPKVVWRETYDRGSAIKVGMINQGSGTTPTLMGDSLIVIADNADEQMNVLFYKRKKEIVGNRLLLKQPVFDARKSATENSLIVYGNSVIVENNYGYDNFLGMLFGKTAEGGLVRLDLNETGDTCKIVWESFAIAQTCVPKLSAKNGLLYVYTKTPDAPFAIDAYYLTAIDFATGITRYKVLTGSGLRYDNNWSAINLAPDGVAYVGTINGLLAVYDDAGDTAQRKIGFPRQVNATIIMLVLLVIAISLLLFIEMVVKKIVGFFKKRG